MRFPVDMYVDSYLYRPARFGNPRQRGRVHAGCDLYVPEGTAVMAVADGVIRSDLSAFYEGTASIVVDHVFFTIRYGELSFEPPIKDGVYSNPSSGAVKEGRVLGYVKRTKAYLPPMLHFEMYAGTAGGPLTDRRRKPTQRRADLVDPTDWLIRTATSGDLLERRNLFCASASAAK